MATSSFPLEQQAWDRSWTPAPPVPGAPPANWFLPRAIWTLRASNWACMRSSSAPAGSTTVPPRWGSRSPLVHLPCSSTAVRSRFLQAPGPTPNLLRMSCHHLQLMLPLHLPQVLNRSHEAHAFPASPHRSLPRPGAASRCPRPEQHTRRCASSPRCAGDPCNTTRGATGRCAGSSVRDSAHRSDTGHVPGTRCRPRHDWSTAKVRSSSFATRSSSAA